jgi:hypothetical protein
MSKHMPVLSHNTMLTNHDVMLKPNEIKIIDDYVISNNITTMDLAMFRNIVCDTLPTWRAEQLCGPFHVDDGGLSHYKKYISFDKV